MFDFRPVTNVQILFVGKVKIFTISLKENKTSVRLCVLYLPADRSVGGRGDDGRGGVRNVFFYCQFIMAIDLLLLLLAIIWIKIIFIKKEKRKKWWEYRANVSSGGWLACFSLNFYFYLHKRVVIFFKVDSYFWFLFILF